MEKNVSGYPHSKYRRRDKGWKRWTRFKKNDDGTAAIEFAIVALPFLLIIFGILEFSFMFLGERIIHVSTQDASRLIRTGQVRASSHDAASFRQEVCANTLMRLFDCNKLHINVQQIPLFGPPPPLAFNGDGTINTASFGFSPGNQSTLNIVQMYYDWPLFVNWGGLGMANWSTDRKEALLGTTHAFMNEPYAGS